MVKEYKNFKLNDVIISREAIEARAAEIGRRITEDYQGKEVTFIGILRGAVMWLSEIFKSVDLLAEVDFMAVSSYGAATKSSGVVRIIKDLDADIEGKHVIIVEDIVDSGTTLNYLKEYLNGRKPASLRICSLLDKPEGRKTPVDVEYVGFQVGKVFIVGFGLDLDQKFRNLPYITSIIEPEENSDKE